MAENMFKKYTESLVRVLEVGANVAGGTAIIINSRPAVTLASSGGTSVTETTNLPGSITSITYEEGGAGYAANEAAVAFDGTWLFTVTGVSNGATVPDAEAGTNEGTAVYRDPDDGLLTLTSTDNVFFGKIDAGYISGGVAPVIIGVPA